LDRELDLDRIIPRFRTYEVMFKYLLTDRQRTLLRYNAEHVVTRDSEDISLDSAKTLFSCGTVDGNRNATIE